MSSRPGQLLLCASLAVTLSACAIGQVREPNVAEIPQGSPGVVGGGWQAVGPVTVVGSGRMGGVGWRYSVFESADGMCTQLETTVFTSASCGELEPGPDSLIGSASSGESGAGFLLLDGIVAPSVDGVVIHLENGERVVARLLPLDEAGIAATAFLAVIGEENRPVQALAVDADGNALGTMELP